MVARLIWDQEAVGSNPASSTYQLKVLTAIIIIR